jgi:ribosomal protein S18 acetylase RimI-like enzyme
MLAHCPSKHNPVVCLQRQGCKALALSLLELIQKNPMQIRKAYWEEHQAVLSIAKTSPYTKDFGNPIYCNADNFAIGAVLVDAGLNGFIMTRVSSRTGWTAIYFLAVHPNAKRQGIGRALIRAVIEQSSIGVKLNCERSNTAAIAFYGSFGFKIKRQFSKNKAKTSVTMCEMVLEK